MELKDIVFHEHVYWDRSQDCYCVITAVVVDDGACIVAEKFEDGDLTHQIYYTEACYLTATS